MHIRGACARVGGYVSTETADFVVTKTEDWMNFTTVHFFGLCLPVRDLLYLRSPILFGVPNFLTLGLIDRLSLVAQHLLSCLKLYRQPVTHSKDGRTVM